ncbi:MAG: hypothetical protein HFH14_06340 [Lachnospiraceae bacterium]|nr:hypothetical protein [Lachnospiraceae bacterium]
MADETGREDIEGISIDEFMSASNDLTADNAGELEDVSIDGAIDDIFNIEDIDLDDISLSDLMVDDLDDDNDEGGAVNVDEVTTGESDGMEDDSVVTGDTILPDGEPVSESFTETEQETKQSGIPDDDPLLTEMEEADDSVADIADDMLSDSDLSEEVLSGVDDIDDAGYDLGEDISEEDIDLMQLLSGGDDDDDFELLDDEEPSQQENSDSQSGKSGGSVSDEAAAAAVETKPKKGNVFADPLSVLSDDADDNDVSVGDVEKILVNAKEKSRKKKKKKGKGIGKIFSNIVDEKELEKVEKEKRDAELAEKKKADDAEKKQKLAEEKAGKKEEKKLAKEQLKESKKQEKEAKKRAKKEAKELRKLEEETEVEGRINKVGAAVVFAVIGCIALFVFFGTKIFSYNTSISNATSYFESGRYEESYNELVGIELKEEDKVLYNKVVTIMYVYKQLDAYDAYYKAGKYPQALDSLLKGIRDYEKYMPDALEFDITDNFDSIKNQIVGELSAEYGITEDMAREINSINDSAEYSARVYELSQNLASNYY